MKRRLVGVWDEEEKGAYVGEDGGDVALASCEAEEHTGIADLEEK